MYIDFLHQVKTLHITCITRGNYLVSPVMSHKILYAFFCRNSEDFWIIGTLIFHISFELLCIKQWTFEPPPSKRSLGRVYRHHPVYLCTLKGELLLKIQSNMHRISYNLDRSSFMVKGRHPKRNFRKIIFSSFPYFDHKLVLDFLLKIF